MLIELDSSLLHIARDLAAAWSANPMLGLQHYDYFDQTLQNANVYANRCKIFGCFESGQCHPIVF